MPQREYQLQLKGYVGGYDFDRNYVDYTLAQHKDKLVHVLIDSLEPTSSPMTSKSWGY